MAIKLKFWEEGIYYVGIIECVFEDRRRSGLGTASDYPDFGRWIATYLQITIIAGIPFAKGIEVYGEK